MTATSEQSSYLPRTGVSAWLESWEFLRWELAPYPGRLDAVARMAIAAALVMVVVMTFRIPNAFLAGYYSLLLARENLNATWRQSMTLVLGFVAGTAYTLLGTMLFRGSSTTHFFWVIGTLFLIFFVMRTATNYLAAAGFSLLVATTLSVWDQPFRSEAQVAATLWQAATVAVGAGVTLATEAVYRLFDRSDPLITTVDDLLRTTQQLVESIAEGRTIPKALRNKVLQYETTGTGRLRMTLARQGVDSTRRAHRSALICLVGRLVELAADLQRNPPIPAGDDAGQLRTISSKIEEVRTSLSPSSPVGPPPKFLAARPSTSTPIVAEMEGTVDLIMDVVHRGSITDGLEHRQVPAHVGLLVPDAFANPEYLRFAFAGCIASSLCYILCNALDWQGISTSVLTCIVTALSTIGTSVQNQVLRLAGFVVGGLIIGIPAQILILPNLDTIFGLTLFFAAVTAGAAWIATSSPRLSYFGLQIALAFYFINFQDFHVPTDLIVARDRVLGVLLGILAMGFIFDRFGPKSDAEQIRKQFLRIVGMLARLGTSSAEPDRAATPGIPDLRSQINENFVTLASQMDSVRFEFGYGPVHARDIIERENVRRAQPALRSIFVLELSLVRHRTLIESESGLTGEQREALNLFLRRYSSALTNIVEAKPEPQPSPTPLDDSILHLRRAFQDHDSPYSAAILEISERMLASLSLLKKR